MNWPLVLTAQLPDGRVEVTIAGLLGHELGRADADPWSWPSTTTAADWLAQSTGVSRRRVIAAIRQAQRRSRRAEP
jgi:hypothetical protein